MGELVCAGMGVDDVEMGCRYIIKGSGREVDHLMGHLQGWVDTHTLTLNLKLPVKVLKVKNVEQVITF